MCTFGLIACYWGRGGRIGYEKKRNSGLFRFKLDSEGILTFVSSRPPITRTYERRHLFRGPCRVRGGVRRVMDLERPSLGTSLGTRLRTVC